MSKIFLFNPPGPSGKGFIREGRCTQEAGVWATQWPPVSLATAAALLEEEGHSIDVIDFPAQGLNIDAFKQWVRRHSFDFALWNTGTPTLQSDLNLARIIKKRSPNTATGVMGTHVSVYPEKILKIPSIDVVIRREPEQIIRNLCRHPDRQWKNIPGLSYKENESGKIIHNPDAGFLPAEKIPAPAWHYLNLKPYRLPLKGKPFLIVAPTRGCPFYCNFCTAQIYYGKQLRKRPVVNVVDEIEKNMARFKIKDFFLWADTFTADRTYVLQFCRRIIARNIKISWACNSRVDTIDKEMLVQMHKAGLWMISYGLESGSEEILRHTGKNITLEQSRTAVAMANGLGLKTSGHFIFGLPGETYKSMQETLRFSLDLPLDIVQYYTAAPFPGTALYHEALKGGWLQPCNGQSQNRAIMNLPGLPAQKVDAFRRHAYKKFYLRGEAIYRLAVMLEPGAVRNLIMNLKGFLQWATK